MTILVENVSKTFGGVPALRNVQLEIPRGSLTRLVGPSGSGKSTLLRLVAGFEQPDEGDIWLNQKKVTTVPPGKRDIGVVFQNYALFPHLTVRENVEFGLLQRTRPLPREERRVRVREMLQLVRLLDLAERYPKQLSGGQKQRVALARALVLEPQVLLLDEPFAALDPKVRGDLREWLRRLHDEVAVTTLLVTHDQQEAMEVADQVVVFRAGRVEQVAAPLEIYDFPANPFVMGFVGTAQPTETRDVGRFGLVRSHELALEKATSQTWGLEKVIYGETLLQLGVRNRETQQTLRIQSTRKQFETWKQENLFEEGFDVTVRSLVFLSPKTGERGLPFYTIKSLVLLLDEWKQERYHRVHMERCPSGLRCRSGTSVLSKANEGSNPSLSVSLLGPKGLEPLRTFGSSDFESDASTIPPRPRRNVLKHILGILSRERNCGCCIMVVHQPSKLNARVRFPSPATS